MRTLTVVPQEQQTGPQTIGHSLHNSPKQTALQFSDNRPESLRQKKLQKITTPPDNHPTKGMMQLQAIADLSCGFSSGPVIQLKGSDALRYAKENRMAPDDFFLTRGLKPKTKLSRDETLMLLNNPRIPLDLREGLRARWNEGLSGGHLILVSDTNYQSELEAGQKEDRKSVV